VYVYVYVYVDRSFESCSVRFWRFANAVERRRDLPPPPPIVLLAKIESQQSCPPPLTYLGEGDRDHHVLERQAAHDDMYACVYVYF
jgi:hypothetical protein